MSFNFKKILITILLISFFSIALMVNRGIHWMFQGWQNITIDELQFTLSNSITGTNAYVVQDFIRSVIPITIILSILIIPFILLMSRKNMYRRAVGFVVAISVFLLSFTSISAADRLNLIEHLRNRSIMSDFIDRNYVDPRDVHLQFPSQKRNLIYIYLESVETTFVDQESGGAWNENLIPELTNLAREHIDFRGNDSRINGGLSLPGSTWTMGGMFAQTAGLPLNLPFESNAMDSQDTFFPQLVTLGGILEEQGYNQGLLVGSDATFGGRKLYYATHGNFHIWDYYHALNSGLIPEDHRVWWGFEDWRLFKIAKLKLLEMATQDEPFHLTMLTVDTHAVDGFVCELCETSFEQQMANVLACSSRQVDHFVNWIKEQDFFENTTIVISTDHPSMDGAFVSNVPDDFHRRTFTTLINSYAELATPEWRREFSTMDLFPTTLAAMGVTIPGDRLGLGSNLFSNPPTLLEQYGIDYVSLQLQKGSRFIDRLNYTLNYGADLFSIIPNYITVGPYNENTGILHLRIDQDLEYFFDEGEFLGVAWSCEEQSDIVWFSDTIRTRDQVLINIDFSRFGFRPGLYMVDIHRRNHQGESILIWSTSKAIHMQ